MRKYVRIATGVATSFVICVSLTGGVAAKTLRDVKTPAENPPTSFKGKQYVDSRGCVFIRAGFGGKVTWVPRVNRQRKVYCSAKNKPSLSQSQLASLDGSVPVVKDAPAKVAVAPAPVKQPVATRKVVQAPPKKAVQTTARPVASAPVVVQSAPAPKVVAAAAPQTRTAVKYKPGAPQSVHPGDLVRAKGRDSVEGAEAARTTAAPQAPVVAAPVPQQQSVGQTYRSASGAQAVHPGDWVRAKGRDSIEQAEPARSVVAVQQSPAAAVQPQQRVVATAPAAQTYGSANGGQAVHPGDLVRERRLKAAAAANGSVYQSKPAKAQQTAGTITYPEVYDPIHDLPKVGAVIDPDVTSQGDAQMALVWTNTVPRKLVKRKVRVRKVALQQPTQLRTTRSTKAYTPKKQPASTGKRYVQIGTFGSAANSNRTVARFQSAGFPVATRSISRNGKALKIVLLGPFGSPSQMETALRSARGAGFGDAFYAR